MRFRRIIFLPIIILILVLGVAYFFVLPMIFKNTGQPNAPYQSSDPSFRMVHYILNDVLGARTNDIYYGFTFWLDGIDYYLPLRGYDGGATIKSGEFLENQIRKVESSLMQKGFKIEESNTVSLDNGFDATRRFAYKFSYEKFAPDLDDMYCIVSTNNNYAQNIYVFCGTISDQDRAYYEEFYSALNPRNKEKFVFQVDKAVGDYATGSKGFFDAPGSGARWYAKREAEAWRQLFETQEYLFCSQVDEHSMPVEIYNNCFLSADGKLRF